MKPGANRTTPIPTIPAIPRQWQLRRNKTFMREVNLPSHEGTEEMLSVSHLTGVTPRSEKTVFMFEAESTVGYKIVRPGDLVINTMWAWMGAAGVSRTYGIVSPAYGVYRLDHTVVDPRWIDLLIRTPAYITEMTRFSRGVTSSRLRLYPDEFLRLFTPLPQLEDQRAIADYLDAETARIDALMSKKRRMIELLDERRDAYVFAGVAGELTSAGLPTRRTALEWLPEIPAHWGVPWLGANHATQLGKMLNTEAAEGPEQRRYLKNTNVQWDSFDLDYLPSMSFDAADRARCRLERGDLLVCEGGEVGRAAVWPGKPADVYFQKALHRVRGLRASEPRFLMYCLWAAARLNVFAVEGNQATIVHLTGEKLREHRFPWPPLDEQHQIVRLIDALRERSETAVGLLGQQIDLLAEHRQALITAAVTGKLEIPVAA